MFPISAMKQGIGASGKSVNFLLADSLDDLSAKISKLPGPIKHAKRLIGRRFSDASVQSDIKLWPFKVISGPGDKPMIVVNYKGEEMQFAAEEISSMVLIKMKEIAEAFLGSTVKSAVAGDPLYVVLCCWLAVVGAGLLTSSVFRYPVRDRALVFMFIYISMYLEDREVEDLIVSVNLLDSFHPSLLRLTGFGLLIILDGVSFTGETLAGVRSSCLSCGNKSVLSSIGKYINSLLIKYPPACRSGFCLLDLLELSLLCDPNPNSPADSEAARMFSENKREYNRKKKIVNYLGKTFSRSYILGLPFGDCKFLLCDMQRCLHFGFASHPTARHPPNNIYAPLGYLFESIESWNSPNSNGISIELRRHFLPDHILAVFTIPTVWNILGRETQSVRGTKHEEHVNISLTSIVTNAQTKFKHLVILLPKVFGSSRLNPEVSRAVSNSKKAGV
ncbi:unnamed protein product [Fraxinus pennsylvanica]|uniref:Uncharacterized protein n=1 Tax=Fraxinus pennsylvanica TaxID=56036 RepID=A0AAD2ABY1_9LAMI|nr:unnamed protein product [Fraxinus pennsylvanica]